MTGKKAFRSIISILTCCGFLCVQNSEAFEIGDLVYREGLVGEGQPFVGDDPVGHTAVYIGYYDHDTTAMVVESMPCFLVSEGEACGVRKVTWATFLAGKTYYGNRTTNPEPDAYQRSQICATALDRIGSPYYLTHKGPTDYDCVGLTEMAYETVGLNPTPDSYETG